MALLKFFEGKESSYSSSSHSGGLYFAKDTGVILFKGVKYGSKPDLSSYTTQGDLAHLRINLQMDLSLKADKNHKHTIDDISDLIIANSDHAGLMSAADKNNLDSSVNKINLLPALAKDKLDIKIQYCLNSSVWIERSLDIISATPAFAGLMSAADKKKLDSLTNTLQALSVQPLNDSSEISPASLIGSDRYDILKGITDKHIGVNAQFTDGKLTIGLYDFNKSEWVGAPSVTIPLQ